MIELTGDKTFAQTPESLYAKLTDMSFLVECIPDKSEVKEVSNASATLTVKPGFSFVRGTLTMTIEKVEENPHDSARLLFKAKGIGSSSDVDAFFRLTQKEEQTLLQYEAKITVGGLLKAVPGGLIKGSAQQILDQLMQQLETKLQSGDS